MTKIQIDVNEENGVRGYITILFCKVKTILKHNFKFFQKINLKQSAIWKCISPKTINWGKLVCTDICKFRGYKKKSYIKTQADEEEKLEDYL